MQGTLQNFFCIFLLFSGLITPLPEYVGLFFAFSARSPPGTLRDLTTPSLGTARAGGGGSETPAGCARADGSSRRRAAGFPGGRCARAAGCRPRRVCPGGSGRGLPAGFPGGFFPVPAGGFPAAGVPGRAKKSRVFSVFFRRASRMYKEAGGSFSEKKPLTFSPGGVMDVSAGRETAQKRQLGTRAGGKSRRRKKGASP